jgi:hypothetical protein
VLKAEYFSAMMFDKLIDEWCIPHDHCRQVSANSVTERLVLEKRNSIKVVLDLGCGEGNSIDFFRGLSPDIKWTGLDVVSWPEKTIAGSILLYCSKR